MRLLADHSQLGVGVGWVVRADLGAEAVLERRDDAPPVGVVLGVGRGHEQHVQGQAHVEAADLHVAFLEHVEQSDLDALGQVRQFVHGEDATVGPGHEAVVQRELVGQVAPLGHLDGVDLTDEIGDRGVGRGQLLREAEAPVHPVQRRAVPLLGHEIAGIARHGLRRVVTDLRARHHRQPLVEEGLERPDDAGLGLTSFAQEDHVVAGQKGVLELGQHRVVEAEYPLDERPALGDPGHGVAPDLLVHRNRLPARRPQLTERRRESRGRVGREEGCRAGHTGEPTPPRRSPGRPGERPTFALPAAGVK